VNGKMVALKNDRVWRRIGKGRLWSDPFPPDAPCYVDDVDRQAAERLHLIGPAEVLNIAAFKTMGRRRLTKRIRKKKFFSSCGCLLAVFLIIVFIITLTSRCQ